MRLLIRNRNHKPSVNERVFHNRNTLFHLRELRDERPARAALPPPDPHPVRPANARSSATPCPPDLVEVDREYQEKVQAVAALKARLTEAELEKRKAEGELADHKEKLKKYQAQLRNVQSSREYSAALNEIDGVEKLDPLDRGPVPRARGRDRDGARGSRRAREEPARRDRAARGAAEGLARRAARDQRGARRARAKRSRASRPRSRRATAPSSTASSTRSTASRSRWSSAARAPPATSGSARPPCRSLKQGREIIYCDSCKRILYYDPRARSELAALHEIPRLHRRRRARQSRAGGRGRLRRGRGGRARRGALRGARPPDEQRRRVQRAAARLRRAEERGAAEVSIASDSLLLVQQMLGPLQGQGAAPAAPPRRGAPAREGASAASPSAHVRASRTRRPTAWPTSAPTRASAHLAGEQFQRRAVSAGLRSRRSRDAARRSSQTIARAAARRSGRRADAIALHGRHQGPPARDRRQRRARRLHALRREPGAGRRREDRGARGRVSGPDVAPDRPAADQQGEDGATILRRCGKSGSGTTCGPARGACSPRRARPRLPVLLEINLGGEASQVRRRSAQDAPRLLRGGARAARTSTSAASWPCRPTTRSREVAPLLPAARASCATGSPTGSAGRCPSSRWA